MMQQPPPILLKSLQRGRKPKRLAQAGMALIAFALLNLVTAFVFGISMGTVISEYLPPDGGVVGPLEVTADRSVYQVRVHQRIQRSHQWSFVSGEVLDANKEYLFGFGDEFWMESGRDSDGPWTEHKSSYDTKLTLEKGTYYLNFSGERSAQVNAQISVVVARKLGSSIGFMVAGVLALIMGVVLFYLQSLK